MRGAHGRRSTALTITGVVLLLAAAGGIIYPLWWDHNSSTGGQHLLSHGFGNSTSVPGSQSTAVPSAACQDRLPSPASIGARLVGVLEIPVLHLKAPVLQGLDDTVLNVAVGHDPVSPWPGRPGVSVMEAHDVSYFSAIGALKKGNEILWRDACQSWTYRVTSTAVSQPGALLYPPHDGSGLALITCYPTNALFWTPDRYVVETELVAARTTRPQPEVPLVIPHLKVPAPPRLVAQGLTLQDNPILLDNLRITGSPATEWREGPAPLDVEAGALESYFGAERAIAEGQRAWWRALAVPGLPMPAAWSNGARVSVTIEVVGGSVRYVTLESSDVTFRLVVRAGELEDLPGHFPLARPVTVAAGGVRLCG